MKIKPIIFCFSMLSVILYSCGPKTQKNTDGTILDSLSVQVPDTTLYGVCGEGTSMHSLELVKDDGTVNIVIDEDEGSVVNGGLLAGDRMAVVCCERDGEMVAQKVLNMTTLLGRWTSLDRNFTIMEDGRVESNTAAETRPYTEWRIVNGHLVLNADTFDVVTLGADSLAIENDNGVFVYKRQNKKY